MARIKNIHRASELTSDKPLYPANIRLPVEWISKLKLIATDMSKKEHPKVISMSDLVRVATYDRWLKE